MKRIVFLLLLVPSFTLFSQKKELGTLCKQLEKNLESKQFHLTYNLSVKGRADKGVAETVPIQLYRHSHNQRLLIGTYQEIIQQQDVALIVNHVQKSIVLQKEMAANPDEELIKNLCVLIDSARSIQVSEKDGQKTFSLLYPESFQYTKLSISFSNKSGELKSIYAEFSPKYPEPYHSIFVKYEKWDRGWQPESGFPYIGKYIQKSGKKYELLPQWNQYTFFQPESGTLKF